MYPFDFKTALYRRNNFGQPCVWEAIAVNEDKIVIHHGIVGKTITREDLYIAGKARQQVQSRVNAKRKTGYKLLSEIKDNVPLPVEESLLNYLLTYLPDNRTTADGTLLPMLAKVYDNTNNKLFKRTSMFFGQCKINGLRCFISAVHNVGDLFKPISLKFQSREGTYWSSLSNLEDYLLEVLDRTLIDKMIDEHYILDGEVYLPGHSVNEINHFVKDPNCAENKLLQYWCYDIAITDMMQEHRTEALMKYGEGFRQILTKEWHYTNTNRFVVLPSFHIYSGTDALRARDSFIDKGFEGLILRDPTAEYQYGKRNLSMIKYKKATDGKFVIVDIIPEGEKRPDIPLLVCRNDVNDELFECHLSTSLDFQRKVLVNKREYIGRQVFIKYGERSGVNSLPFHIKDVILLSML